MDKQLLEKLYDAYYQEIYLYVYALCKNHEWAADLTQETFLKALLSLDQSHTNMRAWLYTVRATCIIMKCPKTDESCMWTSMRTKRKIGQIYH